MLLPEEHYWWEEEEDVSPLPASLFSFLRDVRGFLIKYDQWLLQPYDILSNNVGSMEEDLHKIRSYCEGLNSNLGRPICIQGAEFPDIWCAIDFMASIIVDTHGGMAYDIPTLIRQVEELNDSLKIIGKLQMQLNKIDHEMIEYDGRFTFIQPILLSVSDIVKQLKAAFTQITALESHPQLGQRTAPVDSWMHNFASMPDRAPSPLTSFPSVQNDAEARLCTLEQLVKSLEKCVVGDGIHIDHFLFQSK
jgi:hypothetical protein